MGSFVSVGSVLALCRLFQMEDVLTASLLPKSVTTAIALGIAESQGGIQGVAAAAVILALGMVVLIAILFAVENWFGKDVEG